MKVSSGVVVRMACILLLSLVVRGAGAQSLSVRVLEETDDARLLELTLAWPSSLRAVLDSTGIATLDLVTVHTLGGPVLESYDALALSSRALPAVELVAADYDEVPLPLSAGADSVVTVLDRPLVSADGLGIERKRPVASLVVRHLLYDASSETLRRVRRAVVRVSARGIGASTPSRGTSRLAAASENPHLAVSRSVLADGAVFKLPIREEGVYRLDRGYLERLLSSANLSWSDVRPDGIKIYGNGGRRLPALNKAPRPADLIEVPSNVQASGGEVTEITFYAEGPSGWAFDPELGEWAHYVNPYSLDNFYFIKFDVAGSPPAHTIAAEPFPALTSPQHLETTVGRAVKEYDTAMWSKDGRGGLTWVSRQIRTYEQIDVFAAATPPGLTAGTVSYRARVAVASRPSATVLFLNGAQTLTQFPVAAVYDGDLAPIANAAQKSFSGSYSGTGGLNLTMKVSGSASGAVEPQAAVDWVRAFYPQALQAQNGYLRFATPPGVSGALELSMSGFAQEPTVWDVTDPAAMRRLAVQPNAGRYVVGVDVADAERPREIVAFTATALKVPEPGVRVKPQNLHGITGYPDFVIVTPDTFRTEAEDLAQYRRDRDGLAVEVVGVKAIYNEFSGGLLDPRAIRDYFRFLYDRAPSEPMMLRYALLFGDGHYNYRGLEIEPVLNNWVPPWETDETLNPELSYATDDYFALLDDEEGIWPYGGAYSRSPEKVDIGVGRLTVQTVQEAQEAVAKIKHYEDPETFGPWRTQYLFVADDGPTGLSATNNDYDLHTWNADEAAQVVRNVAREVNLQKVYGVSYDRVFQGIWKIPAAHRDILSAIENGVLAFNYSGHGGPGALAQEELLTISDARALDNFDKLAVFITATCSFGRWDMAEEQSAAEELLVNPHGGAIALLTTVRTVSTSFGTTTLNVGLNRQLNAELFTRDAEGLPRRLGDALRATKNTPVGTEGNNRKFNLLGDPTIRFGFPAGEVQIASINGKPAEEADAEMRALDKVTIAGEVLAPAGGRDEAFNGTVSLSIFDAERQAPIPNRRYSPSTTYAVRQDLIWRGDATVRNGLFSTEFIVPKDISYSYKSGRISAYARTEEKQAFGYDESFIVGGSSANPPNDNRGPEVALFLNDTTFVTGGLTNAKPDLIVKLFDESGINAVGAGVGHELLFILDDDQTNALNLSSRYESEGESYQRGRVVYPLAEYLRQVDQERLSPGPHALQVRAWDVLNNSTTARVDFFVADGEDLVLRNVFNYPNPMVSNTEFVFEHNQPAGTTADVQVRIYTLSGRPVRTIEQPGSLLTAGIVRIPWDGRDEDADRVATGVYLYKVRVKIATIEGDSQVSEHIEKLALIR